MNPRRGSGSFIGVVSGVSVSAVLVKKDPGCVDVESEEMNLCNALSS